MLLTLRRSLVALTLVAAVEQSWAVPSPTNTGDAEQVVFLLQYIGTDYGVAVKDGKVIDEAEYGENTEFTNLVAERIGELARGLPRERATALTTGVAELTRLVGSRGDPAAVRELTETIIPILIEAFRLQPFPARLPDTGRGAELFRENCTICHGERGEGDGPRAPELDPPPAKFTDPDRMDGSAPYVFYNAITLGVANTGMASFRDALSEGDRWNLAFYLWTFAPRPKEHGTSPPFTVSLRDLATKPATELLPAIVPRSRAAGTQLDPATAKQWIAELRAHPRKLSSAEERLARVRQDLASSMASVQRGKLDVAADLVTTSYLNDFEPLEPEINSLDPSVRQRFERGLIEFRAALRRNDPEAAARVAGELEDTVGRAEDLLRTASSPSDASLTLALLGAALVSVAGVGLIVARRGIGKRRRVG